MTQVDAGVADTDAVNVRQLKQAVANAGGGSSADLDKKTNTDLGNITAEGKKVITDLADSVDDTAEVTAKDENLKVSSEKNGNVTTYDVALSRDLDLDSLSIGGKTYISSTGINANNQKITNIAAGKMTEGSTDAVNGDQLYKVSSDMQNSINNAVTNIDTKLEGKANINLGNISAEGKTVIEDIAKGVDTTAEVTTSDKNLKVTSEKNGNVTAYDVALSSDLDLESLSIGGQTYISNTGINANEQKIAGVADGEVSATSKDAVNGSQLHKVSEDLQNSINDINNNIMNTTNNFDVKLDGKVNINLDNINEDGKTVIKELADSVDDTAAVTTSDENLKVTSSKDGNIITYDVVMSKNIDLESLSIDGQTYISSTGINANSQKIVNVASGEVSATSTDAVNGSQLYKVSEDFQNSINEINNNITNNTINFGTKLESKLNVSLDNLTSEGQTVIENIAKGVDTTAEVTTKDKNLKVTSEKNGNVTTYDVAMSRDLDMNSISINGEVYISGTGINANDKTITNVGDGSVSADSKDAVNGGQLYEVRETIIKETQGKLDDKANTSLDNLTKDGEAVIKELANSVDHTSVIKAGDENLIVDEEKDGNNTVYTVKLGDTIRANEFGIGNDVYISADGLNANSHRIINVAAGVADTDAVNVGQLKDAIQDSKNPLSVDYDTEKKDVLTLQGENGTTIDNVKAGKLSKDSMEVVNGSQLYETNQKVEKNAQDIKDLRSDVDQHSEDIKNLQNSVDSNTKVINENSTAIQNLQESDKLGVKYADEEKSEIVLAGAEGTTIKNVKAATADDEAVNFKQLNDAINEVVVKGDKNAIHYSDDAHKTAVLDGEGGTVLSGVANGKVAKDSTEAVNGSQLYDEQQAREKADKELSERIGTLDKEKDYAHISASNNVSQNLEALDKAIEQTAKVVQDDGKEIKIGGESSTKVVNVANANGENRVITGVMTNPADPTSAANVDYVNQQTKASQKYANSIGAQAAAMATLHPTDYNKDGKVSVSAAVGAYKDEVAAAVGAFYRPNRKRQTIRRILFHPPM